MKTFLLTLIISVNVFAQINFNTQFPKIGYFDPFTTMMSPLYYGTSNPQNWPNYATDSYYYPVLNSLGLTHVVTYAGAYNWGTGSIGAIPLSSYNPTLKVLDVYFTMRLTRYDTSNPKFWGGMYADGQGNADTYINDYYQVGGGTGTYDQTSNYGFGSSNQTSVWVTNPPAVGSYNTTDNGNKVFFADTSSVQNSPGNLLEAHLPYYQQDRVPKPSAEADSVKYRLVLNARIDGYTNPNDQDTVAIVKLFEFVKNSSQKNVQKSHPFFSTGNANPLTLSTDTTRYPLLVKNFGGNGYIDLASPYFLKIDGDGADLGIKVYWTKKKNLYIDHFFVYDNFYDSLFISNDSSAVYTNLENQFQSTFGSVVSDSRYSHFYNDEPWPNSYRSVNKLSSLSNQKFSANKYVNGAAGDYANYMLQYGNSQGRPPYLMTDKYPFWYWYDTVSTRNDSANVQCALDSLINAGRPNNSSSGLVPAITLAENYTPTNPSDDIPLVCSIQVQAEQKIANGVISSSVHRSPTPNEIKVQGFLSVCYGAKGLAYYTLNTQTPSPSNSGALATYGLFDASGSQPYNDRTRPITGLVQDPANSQVPNARYYAVQALNAAIDKISGTLLQSTWQSGYSISHGQPSGTFITSVTTPDAANQTYVELGIFKDTSNDSLFMIVNRRTLTAESRAITVNFNMSGSSREISDVASGNAWIIAPNGSFTDNLNPGEGRLYKISSATYATTRTIALGTTLTVNAGATATFAQNAGLTINGKLIVNGTPTSKATFTQSTSNGWNGIALNHDSSTIQNCIISYASSPLTITNVNLATITSCTINNSAFSGTQGVSISNSTPTITGLEIDGLSSSSNGVRYSNGKGGALNGSTIRACGSGNGIVIQGNSNPTISGCLIDTNYYYGIIVTSNGTATPLITGNQFTNNGTHGSTRVYHNLVFLSSSNGTVQSNYMTGSIAGIGVYSGSFPTAGNGQEGSNTITGNDYGLMCRDNGSGMGFGSGVPQKHQYSGTCNNIYGNTYYDAYADGGAAIVAEYNWWNVSPPNTDKITISTVDYSHWLTSQDGCPSEGENMIVQGKSSLTTAVDSSGSISDVYQRATNAFFSQDYATSSILSRFIVRSNASTSQKQRAMVRLLSVFLQSGDSTIISDLKSYIVGSDTLSQTAEGLLAYAYATTGNTSKAVSLSNDLITKNPGTEIEKQSLLLLVSLRTFDKSAESISASALAALATKFGTSLDQGLMAALITGSDVVSAGVFLNKEGVQKAKAKVALDSSNTAVKEYNIANYPNPFNPITTIAYQLPKDGRVTIKIFDAIGREVTTLVDEFKPSGSYSAQFDASRLSSGIYFYSIKSGDYNAVKKMSLIK